MKKKKQKKTDAAGKYTRPAAGPGGSGPGISSGPYGGAQQLPALQTIPFQPLQIQQEPMQPLPLAPGCERGASRGTKERTPADPAGKCGATFEQSENGAASTLPPAGATTGRAVSPEAKWSRTATSAGVLPLGPRRGAAVTGTAK